MTIAVDAWLSGIGDTSVEDAVLGYSYTGADVHLVMNHSRLTEGMIPRWAYVNVDELPAQVIAHDVTFESRVLVAPSGLFEEPLEQHVQTHELIAMWQDELHDYYD